VTRKEFMRWNVETALKLGIITWYQYFEYVRTGKISKEAVK